LVFEQRIEKRIVAGGRFAQASRMMQVSTNLAEHMASHRSTERHLHCGSAFAANGSSDIEE
jgi:hypothetical protein